MKVFINTLGSRGDVQPFVALGQGLQAAGHSVTICTSERFAPFITEHGLGYGYMNDDFLKLVDSDAGRETMEKTTNIWEMIQSYRRLIGQVGPLQREMLRDSWQAAQAAEPDLIVFHPKAYGGPHFAEKLGIPVMVALPVPLIVPTAEHPTVGFPDLGIGWYNRFTYRVVNRLTTAGVGRYVKAWRAEAGLPPLRRGVGLMDHPTGATMPVLHAVSPQVYPRPHEWPDHAIMNGYWVLEEDDDWAPPAELETFLAAGDAPVYVGFGSMAGRDPERLAGIVIEALQQAGVRGVIATGWGGLNADDLPDTLFKIEQAPHEALFPRMAAVVHHGGAGTTAAGLRAGRPTIICPFIADQPLWGERVNQLGVGTPPIPQKQLTAEKLAQAIRKVMTDDTMRQKAAALGEKLRREDGVRDTVAFIEGFVQGAGDAPRDAVSTAPSSA